ncbi:hypothetical protein NK8_57560 (plasmid) [Caballeronia sp. NK8]|uniref:adenylosuccinate synthetase n=1 Tax=Caballeronia sp. NK8 TaxID=140098 RepID=UPI001BB59019|nr:adenylosuccinate synthetase [Caballeronia sp. NK8]BCQ27567.1 hypothetical protein NK8_57560 [Caballeronia sp. NK8]
MSITPGYADVLVGLQYGDEGKAKIVDHLAHGYDIIARFNGGANAGHTIRTPVGSAKLAQVPSGAFHPDKLLYIGSGCAVNLEKLAGEIDALERAGLTLDGRLRISGRCVVVQPVHIRMDVLHGSDIGTTGNGIGPCYADLAIRMRSGCRTVVQLRDLHENLDLAFGQMAAYDRLSEARSEAHEADIAACLDRLRAAWTRIRPFVTMDDLFRIGALDVSQLADAAIRHAVDEIYLNKCDSLALFPDKASGAIPVFDEASLRWFPPSQDRWITVCPHRCAV